MSLGNNPRTSLKRKKDLLNYPKIHATENYILISIIVIAIIAGAFLMGAKIVDLYISSTTAFPH